MYTVMYSQDDKSFAAYKCKGVLSLEDAEKTAKRGAADVGHAGYTFYIFQAIAKAEAPVPNIEIVKL